MQHYKRNTRNVILSNRFLAASGVTNVLQNAGKLSTKGLEIALSGTPIKTQIFHVDLELIIHSLNHWLMN
jgi:hypothetical protein